MPLLADLDADPLEAEPVDSWCAARGDEQALALDRLAVVEAHRHPGVRDVDPGDARAALDPHAVLLEPLLQAARRPPRPSSSAAGCAGRSSPPSRAAGRAARARHPKLRRRRRRANSGTDARSRGVRRRPVRNVRDPVDGRQRRTRAGGDDELVVRELPCPPTSRTPGVFTVASPRTSVGAAVGEPLAMTLVLVALDDLVSPPEDALDVECRRSLPRRRPAPASQPRAPPARGAASSTACRPSTCTRRRRVPAPRASPRSRRRAGSARRRTPRPQSRRRERRRASPARRRERQRESEVAVRILPPVGEVEAGVAQLCLAGPRDGTCPRSPCAAPHPPRTPPPGSSVRDPHTLIDVGAKEHLDPLVLGVPARDVREPTRDRSHRPARG